MDMTQMIEMIDGFKDKSIIYRVVCEELHNSTRHIIGSGYVISTDSHTTQRQFFCHEDVITYLFDLDLFGWQVQRWQFDDEWASFAHMEIVLYRVEK